MNENIIVYDLETQKTFAEVGGADKTQDLLISYLGLYSYSQDKFFGFFEPDLAKLEAILLKERPTIVGFNSISFDNRVLQPYFSQLQIHDLPQIDILAEIYSTLGFRIKLESVAQATLCEGKSGTGLDAIRYFREGNLDALAKYCLDDVRITRDVYEYGKNHGYILYTSGGDIQHMPVSWAAEKTYIQKLEQAWKNHQQVNITYLQFNNNVPQPLHTTVEILEMTDTYIEGYSHTTNTTNQFLIHRITILEVTDTTHAYQPTLL